MNDRPKDIQVEQTTSYEPPKANQPQPHVFFKRIFNYFKDIITSFKEVNKIARRNIKVVFGDMWDVEKIIDQTWDHFGRFIGEFTYVGKMDEAELERRIEIIGIENIKKLAGQPFLYPIYLLAFAPKSSSLLKYTLKKSKI